MPARSLRVYAPMSRFSRTVMRWKSRLPSGACPTPSRAIFSAPRPRVGFPNSRTSPLLGPMRPLIVRSVVVLPAPLLPMSATISPSRTTSDTLLQRVDASVEDVDLAQLDDRRRVRRRGGAVAVPAHEGVAHAVRISSFAPVPRYASMTRGSFRTSAGTTLGDLLAVIQHDDAIAHLHDEAHVVLDEKYRQSLVAKAGDELHQLPLLPCVETGGRLVEQQQTRLGRQRAGDLQATLQSVWHLARVGTGVP